MSDEFSTAQAVADAAQIARLQKQLDVANKAIAAFKEASKNKSQNDVSCPDCGRTVFYLPDHQRRVHT